MQVTSQSVAKPLFQPRWSASRQSLKGSRGSATEDIEQAREGREQKGFKSGPREWHQCKTSELYLETEKEIRADLRKEKKSCEKKASTTGVLHQGRGQGRLGYIENAS